MSNVTMSMSKLLFLIGILLIFGGAGATQIYERSPGKEFYFRNILLTQTNSTWTIDLGKAEAGSQFNVWFTVKEMKYITFMLMRSDTKMPLREIHANETIAEGWDTQYAMPLSKGGHRLPVLTYEAKETANYIVVINIYGDEPTLVIDFYRVQTVSPLKFPYIIHGAALSVVGIVIFVVGIMKRKGR